MIELDIPNHDNFVALSYDKLANKQSDDTSNVKKHYRRYIDKKLEEEDEYIDKHIFDEFKIMKGKRI